MRAIKELKPTSPKDNNTSTSSMCQMKKSYVFIKTHKSGSTTLIAPFQRFAYNNDLYMVVPSYDHNTHLGWPYPFLPINNIIMPPIGKKFEALVNHVVYNRTVMQELMAPSSVYVTVVREPKTHLLSSYNYFGLNEFYRIGKDPDAFGQFLSDPKRHDILPEWMIKLGNKTHFRSFTRNLQSADLGLEYKHFENMTAIQKFVREINEDFHFILVLERLSEALVLMKRKFCWSLMDIIRINKNRHTPSWDYRNISQDLANNAYMWNNADTLLYNMANMKLDQIRKDEERLDEEVKIYDELNQKISSYCWALSKWNTTDLAKSDPQPLTIAQTEFNEEFVVDRRFCVMLLLKEEQFTFIIKCRQSPKHRQCQAESEHLHHLLSLISGIKN